MAELTLPIGEERIREIRVKKEIPMAITTPTTPTASNAAACPTIQQRALAQQGFHVIVHGNRSMDRAEAVSRAIA
jgi:hypothetical protein